MNLLFNRLNAPNGVRTNRAYTKSSPNNNTLIKHCCTECSLIQHLHLKTTHVVNYFQLKLWDFTHFTQRECWFFVLSLCFVMTIQERLNRAGSTKSKNKYKKTGSSAVNVWSIIDQQYFRLGFLFHSSASLRFLSNELNFFVLLSLFTRTHTYTRFSFNIRDKHKSETHSRCQCPMDINIWFGESSVTHFRNKKQIDIEIDRWEKLSLYNIW